MKRVWKKNQFVLYVISVGLHDLFLSNFGKI